MAGRSPDGGFLRFLLKQEQKKKGRKFVDTEKIFSKITPKDYHNELELILENKDFSEDVKNLLLSCIYKIEAGYQDYEIVKQVVLSKKEYLEEILTIIKEKCHQIEIKKEETKSLEQEGKRRYEIDRTEGSITLWHPNEQTILYAIYELDDNQIYVDEQYSLIRTSLSELLNKGENMNRLEVLRDFNGWNWNTNPQELQSITINLVYQNLIDLLGIEFLEKWIHTKKVTDYFGLAKEKIQTEFGVKNEEELFYWIGRLALITCTKTNQRERQYLLEEKKDRQEELLRLTYKKELLEEVMNKNKQARAEIREIDTILNDKERLAEEFIKRNDKLPEYHKIVDLSHLIEILTKQRKKIISRMEEQSKILEPAYYVEVKTKLEEQLELLSNIELEEQEERKRMLEYSIELEKVVMNCFQKRIEQMDNLEKLQKREEIIKAIYRFRYYCYLYFENEKYIGETTELEEERTKIKKRLLQKAEEAKCISKIVKSEKQLEIFNLLFETRIINLENITIELSEEENIQATIYDGDVLEKTMPLPITKKELNVKLDKKIRLLG